MKLFVYGSLLTGFSNHHFLCDSEYLGESTICGHLYDTGLGYPAVKICGKRGQLATGFPDSDQLILYNKFDNMGTYPAVSGELYEVPNTVWTYLDMLEGYSYLNKYSSYFRRAIPSKIGDTTVMSWVYEGGNSLLRKLVESGNWREYCNYEH